MFDCWKWKGRLGLLSSLEADGSRQRSLVAPLAFPHAFPSLIVSALAVAAGRCSFCCCCQRSRFLCCAYILSRILKIMCKASFSFDHSSGIWQQETHNSICEASILCCRKLKIRSVTLFRVNSSYWLVTWVVSYRMEQSKLSASSSFCCKRRMVALMQAAEK